MAGLSILSALSGFVLPALATAAVAAPLATSAWQVSEGIKARKASQDLQSKQEDRQNQLETEAKQRTADEESMTARTQARARQKLQAAGKEGRAGTLLTGSLGVVGNGNTGGGKTLLGQ